MKPLCVLIDTTCWPSNAAGRTGTLTVEHEPEILDNGWLRFKTSDGSWHRLPPHAVKCVTERREMLTSTDAPKTVEVPYLVSKRKPKSV